jgi:hypothetical protein
MRVASEHLRSGAEEVVVEGKLWGGNGQGSIQLTKSSVVKVGRVALGRANELKNVAGKT